MCPEFRTDIMNLFGEMSDRDLYELADGIRHWWNDDNPEAEQVREYRILANGGRARHDRYVADLEACVAEMYRRYEEAG